MAGSTGTWEEDKTPRGPLGFLIPGIKNFVSGANLTPEQLEQIVTSAGGGFTFPSAPAVTLTPGPVGPWSDQAYPGRPLESYLLPPTMPKTATPTGPVVQPTLSPADMAVSGARKMAGQYANAPGLLPWDFWLKNPGVSGGMMRMEEGPMAGKTYSFFEPNKPADMMDTIRPLIQQYADRASTILTTPSSNPLYDAKVMDMFMKNINALIGTGQAGAKVPSEISKNLAEAGRVQIAPNVWSGPNELSTLLIPPGQQARTVATGSPQEKITAADQLFNHAISILPGILKARSEKAFYQQPTDQEDTLLNLLLPQIANRFGGGGGAAQPQHTDQSFIAQLQQKYPGQKPEWYQDQLRKARAGSPQSFGR